MRTTLILLMLTLSIVAPPSGAAEPTVIKVAAYHFPPYFSAYDDQHLVGELLAALNQHQSEFNFELHDVPPQARFQALSSSGCCHLILFEAPRWGWQRQLPEVVVSDVWVYGSERLVAKHAPGRGQDYFTRTNLRFGGLTGYHYPFLGNNTDQGILEQRHNVYVSMSHDVNVRMLLNGRLDVIMLHDEYLQTLRTKPWYHELILKEEPYDEYDLRALINPHKGFSFEQWERALAPLKANGELQRLLRAYELNSPLLIDTQTKAVR